MPKIKLTPEAVTLRQQGWTLQRIADHFGCAKNTVCQYLQGRAAGRPVRYAPEIRLCAFCDAPRERTGIGRKTEHAYCSQKCYYDAIRQFPFIRCVHSTRLAREIVRGIYGRLPDGAIVHHRDGDQTNNAISNLVLFAEQRDHFRYHRRCSYNPPLWLGDPANPLQTFD